MKTSEIFETPEGSGFDRIIKECKPNPGSDEARAMNCKCPILDNGHGRGYMGTDNFVISMDCPLHTMSVEETREYIGASNPQAVQKDK